MNNKPSGKGSFKNEFFQLDGNWKDGKPVSGKLKN